MTTPRAIYQPKGKALEYAPWACNLFTGCAHGCVYCYAPLALRRDRATFHAEVTHRKGILQALERHAPKHAAAHPGEPVLLCFSCDPYTPHESAAIHWDATRHAIDILTSAGVPVHVLTKGGNLAMRDFDLLLRVPGSAHAATITTMDPLQAMRWEPKAATPLDRAATLAAAKAAGLRTWLSLEPVFDPSQALGVISDCAPYVDEVRIGKINHAGTLPAWAQEAVQGIDWPAFRQDAEDLCNNLGLPFYSKESLRRA